jgi:hypothetical protein
MNAREYLEKQHAKQAVTFIIARAVKDEDSPAYNEFFDTANRHDLDYLTPNPKLENAPGYHFEYLQTPLRNALEWLQKVGPGSRFGENYIVLRNDHAPLDIGSGSIGREYKFGNVFCAVITTKADLLTMYTEKEIAEKIALLDVFFDNRPKK